MATDATGTPTSLGIPTFNVDADAPSGLGSNAQMEVIDALIAARATLASPAFTGTPTAPTPTAGDVSTKLATTSFVQALVSAAMPSGTMAPYAGATAPSGWLLADGSAVSRSSYSALFAAIGTAYGAGDGSTTFNLPDMRGRVPVGKNAGTFSALGATGGEETHVLANGEMPVHSHGGITGIETGTHTHSGTTNPGGAAGSTITGFTTLDVTSGGTSARVDSISEGSTSHQHTFSTGTQSANHQHGINSDGGGGAHNNLQPYLVVNHIIKV